MATNAWEGRLEEVQRKLELLQSRIGTAPSLHILTMLPPPPPPPSLLLFSVTGASWTSAPAAEKGGADELRDEIVGSLEK